MPGKKGTAAKDLIYREIRNQIITGKKKPGERLSIEELKHEFGTSVTPVRDALQMLSQEDLVTIKPRSGYYITLVTLKQLNDMLDLRQILELAAVERAAEKITDEQIEELEHVHAGFTDDKNETYSRYTKENKKFHCLIAQASGNKELTRQVEQIHDRLVRYMLVVRPAKYMDEMHRQLISKLKARDPNGAKKTLQRELSNGKNVMIERIMQEEAGSWHLGTGGK
jgi:DNA-binding GntR family transcriptional regulator